tara:strand:+ start:91 stop:663 length:573 start_codon:yes stop_codon:yes gene_type:complete
MSAGAISLESAIRTCKVDTAWANKVESDRFLNPAEMMCPMWNGFDTAGRPVAPDSFMTKTAGCAYATDRVVVENNVSRPQYMEYVTLSANGIAQATPQAGQNGNVESYVNSLARTQQNAQLPNITGQFGNVTEAYGHRTSCHTANLPQRTSYKAAMAQRAQQGRQAAATQNTMENYRNIQRAGFGNQRRR